MVLTGGRVRTSSRATCTTSTRSRPTCSRCTSLLVNAGAMAIAVLFSVLPALRAAMLRPGAGVAGGIVQGASGACKRPGMKAGRLHAPLAEPS